MASNCTKCVYILYILLLKSVGSVIHFFKEIITFIKLGWIKLIKRDSRDIYNVSKRFLFQINSILLNLIFLEAS